MAEDKKNIKLKVFKVIFIGLVILVGVQLLGRFLLTTAPVHNFVKNKIESIAGDRLNGTLSIGEVSGDLWKEIRLTNVSVSDSAEVFTADTLYARYEIWSFLSDVYEINELKAVSAHLNVREQPDTTFNIQHLLKEPENPETEQENAEPMQFILSVINLSEAGISMYSPSYLPDSTLAVRELNAGASFSKTDTLHAELRNLDFFITEGRLPEPVRVGVKGGYARQKVTLQQLVIETGRSMLMAEGTTDLADSTADLEATTRPFSLKDIQPYLNDDIPEEELSMQLSLSGSAEDLKFKLNLDHSLAPDFEMVAGFDLSDEPTLTQFGLLGNSLNIAALTNDSLDAELGEFRVSMSGVLKQDIPASDVVWGFTFNNVRYGQYLLNRVIASGTLKDDDLLGHVGINPQGEEQFNATPTIFGVTSELPEWSTGISIENLDLSHWVDSQELKSDLEFIGSASGKGFSLSDSTWTFSLATDNQRRFFDQKLSSRSMSKLDSVIMNKKPGNPPYSISSQEFQEFRLTGSINRNELEASAFVVIDSSRVDVEVVLRDFVGEVPTYDYSLATREFNAAEFEQLNGFPTSVNLSVKGQGKYLDLQQCEIFGLVEVDSSVVNGARFQKLNGRVDFRDGILNINEGQLQSDIVAGTFTGRKNVLDQTDPENWLNVDMNVKNLQPLAPLADLQRLNAEGMLKGRITQDTAAVLKGDFELDLKDVQIDSLLIASRVFGQTDLSIEQTRSFDFNVGVESPVISGLTFQDIRLRSQGINTDDSLNAGFELEIVGSDRGRITQSGRLRSDLSSRVSDITFDEFELVTNVSTLSLQKPFRMRVQDLSVGTDTLYLKAQDDSTYLNFAVPYADSVEQHAWFEGYDFDFGVMQDVIFGERFLDGVLSGRMKVDRDGEKVTGNGVLTLNRINYMDVEADTMSLRFDLKQGRLTGQSSLWWNNEKHVDAEIDVPFALFRENLGDEFFEQPVSGKLSVIPSNLDRFKPLLEAYGYEETTGILSITGGMDGTAGQPSFSGDIVINQPVLSGIKLDTVTAGFFYDNVRGGLGVNADVTATGQKAAVIQADIPLSYDFRNFELTLPGEEDVISLFMRTENFNLAVLNDFLDKKYMRRLRGRLNANIVLEGTKNNMKPTGYLTLYGGSLTVPLAGVTLEGIRTDMEFNENGLRVKDISMKSGGDFKASGLISLDGIVPDEVDLKVTAERFKFANTANYNLIADLDTRLQGSANTPTASGKVIVRSGFIYLDEFGENTIEEVTLEGEETSNFSPYDSLAIEMSVEVQRDFFVRSRDYLDLEIRLVGNLDAQKQTDGELSLFGGMEGRQGYVRPLGKTFTMQDANFNFSGPVANPDIYVKSRYIPPTRQKGEPVELFYIIEGTLEDPDFSWDSEPKMEGQDIVSYTLFGKPFNALEPWQSSFAGGGSFSATDVLADVIMDEIETLATRELGVDVVQIDNTGTAGGTSIKTGWYLNEKTFFAIVNEITKAKPKTMFILEYILSESWDLILTQGDTSQRGVDLRYQYDY